MLDRPELIGPGIAVAFVATVYGVGYAVAARDPLRHWPIVFVGLLGKILGPIGFAQALAAMAQRHGIAIGVVVDAGNDYEPYRQAITSAGLPVFTRMEDAIEGLKALS